MTGEPPSRTVVVTRPRSEGLSFASSVEEAGAPALLFPVIATRGLPADPESSRIISEALEGRFSWIVLTSANGVAAFAEQLGNPLPATVRLACQGPRTAEAARVSLGREIDLVPEGVTQEELAEALVRRGVQGERILAPCPKERRGALARLLAEAGADVTSLPLYETVPASLSDEETGRLTAYAPSSLLFTVFSPSALRALRHRVGDAFLRGSAFAAFGPVTERAFAGSELTLLHVHKGNSVAQFAVEVAERARDAVDTGCGEGIVVPRRPSC